MSDKNEFRKALKLLDRALYGSVLDGYGNRDDDGMYGWQFNSLDSEVRNKAYDTMRARVHKAYDILAKLEGELMDEVRSQLQAEVE